LSHGDGRLRTTAVGQRAYERYSAAGLENCGARADPDEADRLALLVRNSDNLFGN
jgi:hypothetical protein